ncbi:MAG: FtsX-like permease family protein [Bacteroidota bacterium]
MNRLAADKIGVANLQDAIGKKLSWTNTEENITSEIIGVLDNYLPDSQSEAVPTVFILNRTFSAPWDPEYYTIKFADSGNTSVTSKIDKVNSIWERVFPSDPFLYYFVDDFFELQFSSSRNFMRAISMFSILSILIALIGVLALSSYTNQMKSKEIGIRKVLGAEIKDILLLLIKQYSKLLGIATVVTIIVVYFILENWLRTFSYRMVLSPGLFVIPAFLLFIFILSLITYQSYSSAIVNPVKVLKKE